MQDSPSTAAHRGRRVAEAGGALKLRRSFRVACMRARERARQSGAPPAQIEQARRRAERAEQRCFAVWRTQEAAYRSPTTPRPRAAQRQSRPRARRTAASSTTSSSDPPDDSDSPAPPRLRLRRHPRFGSATPNLLRLLVRAQAEEAQR